MHVYTILEKYVETVERRFASALKSLEVNVNLEC